MKLYVANTPVRYVPQSIEDEMMMTLWPPSAGIDIDSLID